MPGEPQPRTLADAMDLLRRSIEGRCGNPWCPSQHVDDATDCIEFALATAEAAARPPVAPDGSDPNMDYERRDAMLDVVRKTYAPVAPDLDVETLAQAILNVKYPEVSRLANDGERTAAGWVAAEYRRIQGDKLAEDHGGWPS